MYDRQYEQYETILRVTEVIFNTCLTHHPVQRYIRVTETFVSSYGNSVWICSGLYSRSAWPETSPEK